ncbi:hypothetical protein [Dactylosporangium sp. NPDC050588]|uniref:hypothetical protein n=1 Tax=Dactylosporangium sp. NPDC050588 TaxID=3157211 RepID=UPI0033E52F24
MTTTSRTVVGNITLSLDGRIAGRGGPYDMGWIVPHAVTDESRSHMLRVTGPATTALLGRVNYEGFGGFWPAVAGNPEADPKDREFSRWLDAVLERRALPAVRPGLISGGGTGRRLSRVSAARRCSAVGRRRPRQARSVARAARR